tara:strand:+ start:112 stop:618 length:507 start_codon:yes stop_codon:yes gene_type:complete
MGSGKSRVGKALSQSIDISYIDLDSYIEIQEKSSIKNIFSNKGEVYFRKKERQYLEQLLSQKEPIILALGGGTPCYFDTMDFIVNSKVVSFYLKVSIKTLASRLGTEKHQRPLISHLENEEDLHEFIGKHLFERLPFYSKASHIINVDKLTPEAISLKIEELTQINPV